MALQPKPTLSLFDKYSLAVPAGLKWHKDGQPGNRSLFITDSKEAFTISFEEGMKMMDMLPDAEDVSAVSYQCCKDGKYIHLKRGGAGNVVCAFFHMEVEDDDGKTLYLPGQMVADPGYKWSDGIEPVLMELLDGIEVRTDSHPTR